MATAKKIKYDDTEVVVDYAIKDSKGNQIDTTYAAVSNLVTSISESSTDAQYPSAKCVYTLVGDIEAALEEI